MDSITAKKLLKNISDNYVSGNEKIVYSDLRTIIMIVEYLIDREELRQTTEVGSERVDSL